MTEGPCCQLRQLAKVAHGEGEGDLAMGVLEPAGELGVVGHGEGELDVVEM